MFHFLTLLNRSTKTLSLIQSQQSQPQPHQQLFDESTQLNKHNNQ